VLNSLAAFSQQCLPKFTHCI